MLSRTTKMSTTTTKWVLFFQALVFSSGLKCNQEIQPIGTKNAMSVNEEGRGADYWEVCIIGLNVLPTGEGITAIYSLAIGSQLVYHYSNKGITQFCYEGYEAVRNEEEVWVKNLSCDENHFIIAYLCRTSNCNTETNSKLKVLKDATIKKVGLHGSVFCPAEDFFTNAPKDAVDSSDIVPRTKVKSCFTTVDKNMMWWGIPLDLNNQPPSIDLFGADGCIIGLTNYQKSDGKFREGNYFRQGSVFKVSCAAGFDALEKNNKTGVVLKNFVCDDDFWDVAYICNKDNCNVDGGCHTIPMQYHGNHGRRCRSLPKDQCPKS